MADISKNNLTVVVCTDDKCRYHNVFLDQNKLPKFCSLCCKELPRPISADHSTKETVQKLQKPQTGKVFGNTEPTTDLSLDKKSSTGPPNENKLPIQESHDHETCNDKHDDKLPSKKPDDDKSPSEGSDDNKPPNNGPCGNEPPDGKPFKDKPTGIKPNDQLSTEKSPSEKPANNSHNNKPCSDRSSGDNNKLVCNNKVP